MPELPDLSSPPFVAEPVPSEDDPFAEAAISVPASDEEVVPLAAAEEGAFIDAEVAVAEDGGTDQESVFGDDAPLRDSGASEIVSPTLAALYEKQGYHHDAGSVLQSLADQAASPDLARQLSERARTEASRSLEGLPRLRSLAAKLPVSPRLQLEDLHSSLKGLSAISGVTSGALTDSEGLPVVAFSNDGDEVASEAVSAELTAFWKALNRSAEELGGGAARFFTMTAGDTVAAVCRISEAYVLILRAEASVPLGQLRYEALRTASRLSPLLG
ncbi:MAG: hypothetical protein JNK60_08440 [Acidobacteria bacterium]|nr:hypothetical protein [Acidobacteriota bacterium]